jgi:hypothetical protein
MFLRTLGATAFSWPLVARAQSPAVRPLANGVVPADPWPPPNLSLSTDSIDPPYLADPPAVIPIDVGRQLFVDDFLIEESSLTRRFHRATYHPANPVLHPMREYERHDPYAAVTSTPPSAAAMPFSDGVFFDARDRLFKMWYMGGYQQNTSLAVSTDGISWERPSFDVRAGTNVVLQGFRRDSATVWIDEQTSDPRQRYKLAVYDLDLRALRLYVSGNGVNWHTTGVTGPCGDRSTFFREPFRNAWVFSLRDEEAAGLRRYRRYFATNDFASATWKAGQPVPWTRADDQDHERPDYRTTPELYNLDAVGYESLMLGLFTMFRGERPGREKPNDICVAFSRDGFHWSRLDREPLIGVSEQQGDWNWGNVQSAGGCCVIVGDRLHFYVSGRSGVPGTTSPGVCSTGLATLRRDGFASLDDSADARIVRRGNAGFRAITTRPVRFSGSHLFVNASVTGSLQVEVLDRAGRVVGPFTASRSSVDRGDHTQAMVTWAGLPNLASLSGEPVRFRFILSNASLFAFWVSPSSRGESHGYVAAGEATTI